VDQAGALNEMLQDLVADHFYGEVLIKFENGRIVVVKKTESIKLEAKS